MATIEIPLDIKGVKVVEVEITKSEEIIIIKKMGSALDRLSENIFPHKYDAV